MPEMELVDRRGGSQLQVMQVSDGSVGCGQVNVGCCERILAQVKVEGRRSWRGVAKEGI
jgi:hypothetical protein